MKLFLSTAKSEHEKSINLMLLETQIIFKISVFPDEGSRRLLFLPEGISKYLGSASFVRAQS